MAPSMGLPAPRRSTDHSSDAATNNNGAAPMIPPPVPESIAKQVANSKANERGINNTVITSYNVSAPDDLKISQVVDAPKHSESLWSKGTDDDESFATKINEFAKLNDRSSRKLVDVMNQDEILTAKLENEEKQWMDDVESVIKNDRLSNSSYTTKLKSGAPVGLPQVGLPPPPMFSETGAEDGGMTSDDIHEWLKTRMNIYNQNHERRGTTLQQIRDAIIDQDARKEERERGLSQSVSNAKSVSSIIGGTSFNIFNKAEKTRLRKLTETGDDEQQLEKWFEYIRSEASQMQLQITSFGNIAREMPLPAVEFFFFFFFFDD